MLRAAQFPEDAGPLAHPVRPDSYIEISNFYTATVYNKGAELIRMMHTMLGPEQIPRRQRPLFRAPRRRGGDLRGFRPRDGGSERRRPVALPPLVCAGGHAAGDRAAEPRRVGANRASRSRSGGAADAGPAGQAADADPAAHRPVRRGERRRGRRGAAGHARPRPRPRSLFDSVGEPPVLSINRDFSAPVIVDDERAAADLGFLSAQRCDPFARYEAMQQLMLTR